MRMRGWIVLSVVAACGQSAPPSHVVPVATPAPAPVARVAPPRCAQLTTLAAYLGEHVEAGNEGVTDRPPPTPMEPWNPPPVVLTREERQELARRPPPITPLGGAVIGEGSCMLTGKLATAVDAVLATPPATTTTKRATNATPDRLALVDASLRLTKAETAKLDEQGLVALDRFEYPDYATALYEVYRRDLPLYVSVDPILHAHYIAHDSFLADIETSRLIATTTYLIESLACALPAYSAQVSPTTAKDLDLYLTTARVLITDDNVESSLGDADTEKTARALAARARVGHAMSPETLFGRERMIDWTQFVPRGHYAPEDARPRAPGPPPPSAKKRMGDYFRALMWLSRIELDLGGGACAVAATGAGGPPADRDTLLAFALVDLVHTAEADDALADLDRVWAELAGAPEAARFPALAKVRAATTVKLTDPGAAAALRGAIGTTFSRTVRTSYVASTCTGRALPTVTSLIAPGVGADAAAMMPLTVNAVVDAPSLAFMLGHDVAPQPTKAQRSARTAMTSTRASVASAGTYGAWLDAVLALADPPTGMVPAALTSEAGRARRAESALVGYAQLRSANILLAAQTYGEDACSIPDAYVEPMPAVFAKLAVMAERNADLARAHAMPLWVAQFTRMAQIDRVLAKIAEHELTGAALTADMQRFLGMVVEIHADYAYGGAPSYNGWFFDLFRHLERDAFHDAGLATDVFTEVKTRTVMKIGASSPVLGVVTIETGGKRRVVVGPIAHGIAGAVEQRARSPKRRAWGGPRDDTADLADVPWRTRFAVETPPIYGSLSAKFELPPEHPKRTIVVRVESERPAPFTIELLGANRRPIATKKITEISEGGAEVRFALPRTLSAIHIQNGESHAWLECRDDPNMGPLCDDHDEQEPGPSKRPDLGPPLD